MNTAAALDNDKKKPQPGFTGSALFLSCAVFVLIMLVFIMLSEKIQEREANSLRQTVNENAALIAANFHNKFLSQVKSLKRMAERWMAGDVSETLWRKDATGYLRDLPGLLKLEIDAQTKKWSEEQPRNEKSLDKETEWISAIRTAKRAGSGEFFVYGNETTGELAVLLPLQDGEELEGFLLGVFDRGKLMSETFSPLTRKYYDIVLSASKAGRKTNPVAFESRHDLTIGGALLSLYASPTPAMRASRENSLPVFTLLAGAGIAFLASIITYYVRRSFLQAIKLREKSRQLLESDMMFQRLVDGVVDYAIYMLDESGYVKSWNSGARRIKQYTATEILGRHFSVFYTPEDNARGRPANALITAATQGKYEEEGWRVRKDGSRFWASVVIDALHSPDGKIIGFAKVARDATELKKQAEALKSSEETFRLAMEHAAIGKALVSLDGKFLKVNAALCRMLGYDEPELLGLDFQAVTHPDDLDADLDYVRRILSGEAENYQMEKRYIHKQGQVIWILLNVSLVRKERGIPAYFVAEIQNLTEQKKTESEREALIQKLIDSNSELERFAFIASHDLQEPLRLVSNFSSLLKKESEDFNESSKEYINIISASAKRMHSLVEELLEYARIGNEHEGHERFSAMECVNYIRETLRAPISNTEARILCDPLPELYGNPVRFSTLLQNLVGNALKYRKPDIAPVISIGVEDKGMDWVFHVEDNGIGMKEEYCDQIFEPFKRLHNKQEYPGTGMGLAICRKIVEVAGGRIWVSSEPGRGSTFYFTVRKPLALAA